MKVWIQNLDRRTMIDALIQGDIETNGGDGDWFVASLLRDGCKGYAQLTDDELRALVEEHFSDEDEDPEQELAYVEQLAALRAED